MKILLTGKNGQVGFELRRALAPLGEVHAVGAAECDLRDSPAIRGLVRDLQPDVIVNPAAYTTVDKAESDRENAEAVNAHAPAVLAEEAEKLGALLVHYSTDYIFDGIKTGPYVESDPPNPQNVYGATKRAGEQAVQSRCGRHLILRTSWVVGAHGHNFARTILRLAAERDRLRVVVDQIGAPTSAAWLADLTAHLLRQAVAEGDAFPFGLYHATNSGATSWHGYARHLVERAQRAGYPLKARPDGIEPIPTEAYPTPAKRPANSCLDTTRLEETFRLRCPPWQESLDHLLDRMLSHGD